MSGPLPVSGIVFDLDRTLLDVRQRTDYGRALTDVRRLVAGWKDVTTPDTSWDGPMRTCLAVLVALSGDRRWQRVSDAIALHELAAVADSQPMPGAAGALASFSAGPRAVVTVLPERAARAAMSLHGLEVDAVVARRPGLRPRPASDELEEAARMLGLDPAAMVMVGSTNWDSESAEAAGCGFVGVASAEGLGFDLEADVFTVPGLEDLDRNLVVRQA